MWGRRKSAFVFDPNSDIELFYNGFGMDEKEEEAQRLEIWTDFARLARG